jgi:dephospho-CoA kinase
MLVVGLTGSIGMGKSAAAAAFAARGVPVLDADAEVHRLYEGPAVAAVAEAFPEAVREGCVDRTALAQAVAGDAAALKRLERIVHPLVVDSELNFLREQERAGAEIAVLEIPLLFETDAHARVDVSVVVSAPEAVQRERVLARPGMSEAKFTALMGRQLPDAEKRKRADFVVDSGGTLEELQVRIDRLLDSLRGREGKIMERLRDGRG